MPPSRQAFSVAAHGVGRSSRRWNVAALGFLVLTNSCGGGQGRPFPACCMSMRMTSNCSFSMRSSASKPFTAITTVWPRRSRMRRHGVLVQFVVSRREGRGERRVRGPGRVLWVGGWWRVHGGLGVLPGKVLGRGRRGRAAGRSAAEDHAVIGRGDVGLVVDLTEDRGESG